MRYKFVDKINKIEDGLIEGIKCISLNEDIFNDHFENMPMIPAAMMSESSLELARYYVWYKSNYLFTILPKSFKKFKFYKIAEPGSSMVISNKIDLVLDLKSGHELTIKTIGVVDGDKIFEGIFTAIVFDFCLLHEKDKAKKNIQLLHRIRD